MVRGVVFYVRYVASAVYWQARTVLCRKRRFFVRDFNLEPVYRKKIITWRVRELGEEPAGNRTSPRPPGDLLLAACGIHRRVMREIRYVEDILRFEKKDFWCTSRATERAGVGDCEDMAILILARMQEAGFPEDRIGVATVPGHAFAVYHEGDDFYVLDNGRLARAPVKASVLFARYKGLRPDGGFDFERMWTYEYLLQKNL